MTDTTLPPGDDATTDRIEPVDIQQEMQRSYIDYAMSVIVGRALPGGPRRAQAGAPPRAVRRCTTRLPPRPRAREIRALGCRDDGQLPPARRLVDLRHPGPDGPAVVAALSLGRRTGQLRLAGQRPAGRHALHRGAADSAGHGDAARNRRGDSRFHPELRRPRAGADRAAQPVPQPAGQRLGRYRGRHGHQHAAAQPPRAWPRRSSGAWTTTRPTRRPRWPRSAERVKGPRLPDLRTDRRIAGHPRRVHDGPRLDPDARRGRGRRGLARGAPCS